MSKTNELLRGVALLIRNWQGNCLWVEERVEKPHLGKYAHMWSIPMETIEPGQTHDDALTQLVKEEVPWLYGHLESPPVYRGEYYVTPCARAWLYEARTMRVDVPEEVPLSDEINRCCWIHPAAAYIWNEYFFGRRLLRQGVPEMLEALFTGREHVICTRCAPVRQRLFAADE